MTRVAIDQGLLSPSGRISKRARLVAQERVRVELFGIQGLQRVTVAQPSECDCLLRQASQLRELAARGMKPITHIKKAEQLETQARFLKACGVQR